MKLRLNRRQAIIAGLSSVAWKPTVFAHSRSAPPVSALQPICVFTKPFNSLSFDQLAESIAGLGFDGIEAPIRKGGHIEPAEVEDKLPKLVQALAKRNLRITIMTSDIDDPTDPVSIKVLRTAAGLGIKRYRMKYLKYDMKRSISAQLENWSFRFKDLAALNRELGVTALYQNHASNKNLGAAIWDLQTVLEGIPVNEIGVAYDIRHATVEGGTSWPITFNMIRPHIDTVYVKDFRWDGKEIVNVPLGEGNVDPKFFSMLAASGFDGPISLHEEYLDHRKPGLVTQHLAAINNDLQTLKKFLGPR